MTRILTSCILGFFLFTLCSSFSSAKSYLRLEDFSAGVAALSLDTPQGISLAGYLQRRVWKPTGSTVAKYFAPSTGKLDDVRVKAVVMKFSGQKLAMVSIDLVAIFPTLREKVIDRLGNLGYNHENFMLAAVHTHSGPGGYVSYFLWEQLAADQFLPSFFSSIVDTIVAVVRKADAAARPAKIAVGQGRIDDISVNRRTGALDPVTTLIRIDDRRNQPLANMVFYPVHGTLLPVANLKQSSDVPGAIERFMEKTSGAPTLFFQAAGGDIAPRAAWADQYGLSEISEKFAIQALPIWKDLRPVVPSHISLLQRRLETGPLRINLRECIGTELGLTGFWKNLLPQALPVPNYLYQPATLTGLLLDRHIFVLIPGEVISELGMLIKSYGKSVGYETVTPVSLANGYISYILSKKEYEMGGYEACNSLYGPNLGVRIIKGSASLIDQMENEIAD